MAGEAVTAVHRTISAGLEGDLRGGATFITDHIKHLAVTAAVAVLPAIGAAVGATAGLILEALLGVESLLGTSEGELGAALAAGQGLVGIHDIMYLLFVMSKPMRSSCFRGFSHQSPDDITGRNT